ncbi:unconventional myosin-XVIIIa-like isoform X1 [Pseudochaenichthys georgianus]|uniref:unconventional myosin-XVIIIa-like isoform X1 n=1 Tax=Pseudochaenichthys georgianus TaxID=52239 RepID=UPI0039C3931F
MCVLQEMQVEELSAVRQALQADLETSIRRIVDLQAALEEVESSDESDSESERTAVTSLGQKNDLDSVSSVGTEDVGEGIRHWLGVPRGGSRGAGSPNGSSTISSQGGRQSLADTMSTYSFRSCENPDDDDGSELGGSRAGGSRAGGGGQQGSESGPLLLRPLRAARRPPETQSRRRRRRRSRKRRLSSRLSNDRRLHPQTPSLRPFSRPR